MIAHSPSSCAHCGLPIGTRATRVRVAGEHRAFCCYGCALVFRVRGEAGEEPRATWLLVRLGAGAFFSMNVMLASLWLYTRPFAAEDAWLLVPVHAILAVLATAAVSLLVPPLVADAARAFRRGHPGAESLVALGSLAAWSISIGNVLRGEEMVWFDVACAVPLLFTLGRWIEAIARARAARGLDPLLAAERRDAIVIEGDREERRPVGRVPRGAAVRVPPGETIPVDGIVREGRTTVDASILTGESLPVPVAPGDAVLAGSTNGEGSIRIEVTAAGSETRWARIGRSVRRALERRSPLLRATDRAATALVPLVLLVAAGTLLVGPGGESALAVLVVACPCALGLSAPLALALGIGEAARRGVAIRDAATMETLAGIRVIAFDKTGTLSRGSPRVVVVAADQDDDAARDLLRHAASVERASGHPLARGIVDHARTRGLVPGIAASVRAIPGMGVVGRTDAGETAVGGPSLFRHLAWDLPEALERSLVDAERSGRSVVLAGWDGRALGTISLEDELLVGLHDLVDRLGSMGVGVHLLSGDREAAVARTARTAGIATWRAGLSPEDKRAIVAATAAREGPVAMVGDGINDGPGIATASVGIAVREGTDFAGAAADVVLPRGFVPSLDALLRWARRVRATVRGNLAWAVAYNAVAMLAAATGHLRPVLAAIAMVASSLTVVAFTTARLQRM